MGGWDSGEEHLRGWRKVNEGNEGQRSEDLGVKKGRNFERGVEEIPMCE